VASKLSEFPGLKIQIWGIEPWWYIEVRATRRIIAAMPQRTPKNSRLGGRLLFAIAFLAAVLLPAVPCAAQNAASAKALLTNIFQHYGKGGKGRKGTDFKIGYFHSSLVELVDTDIKAAGSGIPAAGEGDPICDCQEWDGFFVLKMDVTMETPQRAQAVVSFAIITPKNRPKDDSRTVKITLISERGEWRIYDIEYLAEPYSDPAAPKSFRQQIQKDIDFYAHQPKS